MTKKNGGDKKSNVADVDTSDLLKALRATHEEPPVSQLASDAADAAALFDDAGTEVAQTTHEVPEASREIFSESDLNAGPNATEKAQIAEALASVRAFEELNEKSLPEAITGILEPQDEALPAEALPAEALVDALARDLDDTEAKSILESVFFASSHPVSLANLKNLFEGTNIDAEKLAGCITSLQTDYAGGDRGLELAEVAGGYQLRTKLDNAPWLKRMIRGRTFKLSGPSLEVLSIVAYKQPVVKSEVDHIRGVESSHLLRALMEKNLVRFAGKSELPGKPMLYGTTKDFLELFGLRNIRELPTLSEIDELIPEGIGEVSEIEAGETLGSLAGKLGLAQGKSYSDSENELLGISDDLARISTSSEFFEQEKIRERERRDSERAQDLKERRIMGEELSDTDSKWLKKFDQRVEALAEAARAQAADTKVAVTEAELIDEILVDDDLVAIEAESSPDEESNQET